MAVSQEQIRVEYPLPVYNYRVDIAGTTVAFSEVSGLSRSHETTTYKESRTEGGAPGPRVLFMPGQTEAVNITLKKGLVRGQSVAVLYKWIQSIQINQVEKKDVVVHLCDEKGETVVSWKVLNAFPTKLEAPSFDANSNDVAVESMELMADGVEVAEV